MKAKLGVEVSVLNMQEIKNSIGLSPRIIGEGVGRAFKFLSADAKKIGFKELDRGLTIRSRQYIKTAHKSMPSSEGQVKSFSKSFVRSGDSFGASYIRGSNIPKNDMGFLLDHERGTDRTAHGGNKWLMNPMPDLSEGGDYRDGRGRTKPTLLPGNMPINGTKPQIAHRKSFLVRYEQKRRSYNSSKRTRKKGYAPKRKWDGGAFIITVGGANGSSKSRYRSVIKSGQNARHRGKLKFLYQFLAVSKQSKKTSWIGEVSSFVSWNMKRYVQRQFIRYQ